MLQDRLNKIKEYFQRIELFDGKWVICVKYHSKWGAYPSADGKIEAVPDENVSDTYWYYSQNDDVDVDSIIDLIEETIQVNLDAIKKVELYNLKVQELKKIFSDENMTLKMLQSLEFKFDEQETQTLVSPKKKKRGKISSKKEILSLNSGENEPISDEKTIEASHPEEEEKNMEIINATSLSEAEIDDLRG